MSSLFVPISTFDPYRRHMFEAVETGLIGTVERVLVRNHSDNEFFAHLAVFRGYKNIYDLLNISIDSRYLANMYVVNGCYDKNMMIYESLEHPYTLADENLYEQILRDHPNDFCVRLSVVRVCIRHSFDRLLLNSDLMPRTGDYLVEMSRTITKEEQPLQDQYNIHSWTHSNDYMVEECPHITKSSMWSKTVDAERHYRTLAESHRHVTFCTSVFDACPKQVEYNLTLLHTKMRTNYRKTLIHIASCTSVDTLKLWFDPEQSQDNIFVAAGSVFGRRLDSYEFIGVDLSYDIPYLANMYLAHDRYEDFQRLYNRNGPCTISFRTPIWQPWFASERTYIRLFEDFKTDQVYSMLLSIVSTRSESYETLSRILRNDERWNDGKIEYDKIWQESIAMVTGKKMIDSIWNEWKRFETSHSLNSLNMVPSFPRTFYEALSQGCIESDDLTDFLERKKKYKIIAYREHKQSIPKVTVVRDDLRNLTATLDDVMATTGDSKFLTEDWVYLYDMLRYVLFEQYDRLKSRFIPCESWNMLLCEIVDFLGDCVARDIISADRNRHALPDTRAWHYNLLCANHLPYPCKLLSYPEVHPWTCSDRTYPSNMPQQYHYKCEKIFDFGLLFEYIYGGFIEGIDPIRGYSSIIALYNTLPVIIALLHG
ncbi:hypothetical protein DFQ28_000747 [Apophysomyces sp. BC1034]|nr:hypothetical protein DFQ30_002164 [Apophysomyces sp. BC1015]KAG0182135.1 hypothetical protein DFQ29_005634 [Apophysomyces sp. BC1021]KAG0191200.1 hypothetical protein DFQ28_000747 [Apophysomyces sp. BC1034]